MVLAILASFVRKFNDLHIHLNASIHLQFVHTIALQREESLGEFKIAFIFLYYRRLVKLLFHAVRSCVDQIMRFRLRLILENVIFALAVTLTCTSLRRSIRIIM